MTIAKGPEGVPVPVLVRQLLASPEPIAIALGQRLLALHNDAFAATIGIEPLAGSAAAQPLSEVCAGLWPRLAPLLERARFGVSVTLEDQLHCRSRNGTTEETYLRLACCPLRVEETAVIGAVVSITDQTERVIAARRTAALHDIATTAAAPNCSVPEACQRAMASIGRHATDLPFALLYLRSDEHLLRLIASAGLQPETEASPTIIRLDDHSPAWPIAEALRRNDSVVIENLLNRFGTLPAGDWPFAPQLAVATPIGAPGREGYEGVLVCGVSARHGLDPSYRAFIDLVANHMAGAIAGGRVHEEEARAAQTRAAARLAQAKRRARLRAMKAKFAGVLEERTRLSRELHDTLLQGVTGIAIQLRAVLPDVRATPEAAAETLERIVELAERTSTEAREAVWDMRPSTRTQQRDVARTLELTARRLTAGKPIQLHVSATGRARALPPDHRLAVIRIAQEAVANAVRHAEARTLRIHVQFGNRKLRLTITDDGQGFGVEKDFHAYRGHFGLLGMQERATGLGGELMVESFPRRGTRVTLLLPEAASQRCRASTGRL